MTAVSDAMMEQGAISVDVADAEAGTDRETLLFDEPGADREATFRMNRVTAFFQQTPDVALAVERARSAAGYSAMPDYTVSEFADQDWVRLTQAQFAPIQVSNRLWIVPSWHAVANPQAINIILDPGLAFGTGSHPTTLLCLDWLEQNLSPGCSMTDYGCGSGILAIAAAKLGATRVRGVDIDEQAVMSSRFNAQRNNVVIEFSGADERAPEPADIVMANILSNPLKVLAPLLAAVTLPAGKLVLSGILPRQAEDVAATYAPWFAIEAPVVKEGWVRLSGMRVI